MVTSRTESVRDTRTARTYRTPPDIARERGVSPAKILALIRSGQLAAINMATKPNGRPRYLVSEAALADFDARRSVRPPTPKTRRRRRRLDTIEFF